MVNSKFLKEVSRVGKEYGYESALDFDRYVIRFISGGIEKEMYIKDIVEGGEQYIRGVLS